MAKNINCRDLGAPDCSFSVTGDDVEEIVGYTLQHATQHHGMNAASESQLAEATDRYTNAAVDV